MERYVDYILRKLIKKYENSKLSKEGSVKNIKISFNFDTKNMNDYVSEDSYKYENLIEQAVAFLENKSFIHVYRKKGRIIKVSLNILIIDEIYNYLHLVSKKENEILYRNLINKYCLKGKLVNTFGTIIIDKMDKYKSYKSYFNSKEELEEILIILDNLEKQTEEISKRNFSAKYLNDSKRLEQVEGKITKIIRECLSVNGNDDITDIEDNDILTNYNIVKNPTFIYIKGHGKFKVNNQEFDLSKLEAELILSTNHLKSLKILELNCENIVTIENLTTFYEYPINNNLIIYLGGFHNSIRREFLCKLNIFDNNKKFYHCGDIDAGGFYILNHLIEKTGINFIPIKMDIETLERYSKYTKELTKEDEKRLNDIKLNAKMENYINVIDYMLKHNIKLEQENIEY